MKTTLYKHHNALGAKFVDFGGWEMPVQYTGVIEEHKAVRNKVGIFDVSHMGCIGVTGHDAQSFLDYISTNTIAEKSDGTAIYTAWSDSDGGTVDDVMVYKENPGKFFIVVNATNRQKDLLHLQEHSNGFDVTINPHYTDEGILAVQGPSSINLMKQLFPEAEYMKPFHFMRTAYHGMHLIISRTGYTGEEGFELFAPLDIISALWEIVLEKGRSFGIKPIGLGARDTLRMEMGYALYGHELSDTIAPTESVSAWTVKFKKEQFIGKEALKKLEKSPEKRKAYGVILKEEGIPREGYPVYDGEKTIGVVTSGGYSPSLEKPIALVLLHGNFNTGHEITIGIRNKKCLGAIAPLPFYHHDSM